MDIFHALTMLGGLSLFLFGMNLMGQALERRAGGSLEALLKKLTTNKIAYRTGGYGGDPELLRDNRHGSRLCKLRAHDA